MKQIREDSGEMVATTFVAEGFPDGHSGIVLWKKDEDGELWDDCTLYVEDLDDTIRVLQKIRKRLKK